MANKNEKSDDKLTTFMEDKNEKYDDPIYELIYKAMEGIESARDIHRNGLPVPDPPTPPPELVFPESEEEEPDAWEDLKELLGECFKFWKTYCCCCCVTEGDH